jgi:hypothetical protein
MVKTILVYGSEILAMTKMDMKRMGTWEGEILRRIHGPVVQHGIWRKRNKQELREL